MNQVGHEHESNGDQSSLDHRVLVAQIGARRHYAVPRIFYQEGSLGALHTDICAVKGWPRVLDLVTPKMLRTVGLRRLFGRVPAGIPNHLIRTEDDIGWKYAMSRRHCRTNTESTIAHLWATRNFGQRIVSRGMEEFTLVYAFSTDGMEVLEEGRRLGIQRILDQTIPPRESVVEMLETERSLFPHLVGDDLFDSKWQELADREKREWDAANIILCGSPFVMETMIQAGGPKHKIKIVPTGVSPFPEFARSHPIRENDGPMNVLFVGEVGVRKGAHYLVEAARRLGKHYRFRLCGEIRLPSSFLNNVPSNVELLGAIPRVEMMKQYHWAHLFCSPSLLEGSAAVTYEAMAAGIPIIATPNSGSLVRDGIDGYVVPARDVDALCESLTKVRDGALPRERSYTADRPGGPLSFTLEAYRERLAAIALRRPGVAITADRNSL